MEEANPILAKLKARPSAKKLVETALILSKSDDPQQKEHAYSFMQTAVKELEDDEKENHKLNENENDNDNDHTIHEEELDNHNNGPREEGSEQSSDNEEPYPGTADDSTNGEKPMQDMDGTVNQWNETGGMPPGMGGGMGGGMPPGMPGAMQQNGSGMIVPGLAPDIAQEMGMGMPQMPPMDTNQMMRQMQYTVNKVVETLFRKQILPFQRIVKQQKEAIKELSIRLTETTKSNSSMSLDIDSMRKNSTASFRETVGDGGLSINDVMFNGKAMSGLQPQHTRKKDKLDSARSEINEMNKIINSENSTIYG